MGYLNNTTVTVDAILTKKGRELLAKGASSFNITQFALADDEIDYDLWNGSHPLGDEKMGIVIENLPITEAVPDETQSMKYKLITLSEGTRSIPYIESTPSSLGLTLNGGASKITATTANVTVLLKQWSETGNGANTIIDNAGGYTFTMLDTTYFTVLGVMQKGIPLGVTELPMSGKSKTWNTTSDNVTSLEFAIGLTFADWPATTLDGKSTKLIITNTRYGSRFVVPISYSNV
jgi:hypothetical protein